MADLDKIKKQIEDIYTQLDEYNNTYTSLKKAINEKINHPLTVLNNKIENNSDKVQNITNDLTLFFDHDKENIKDYRDKLHEMQLFINNIKNLEENVKTLEKELKQYSNEKVEELRTMIKNVLAVIISIATLISIIVGIIVAITGK